MRNEIIKVEPAIKAEPIMEFVHDFFQISEERADEMANQLQAYADEFINRQGHKTKAEFITKFMSVCKTENEKRYLCYTAGEILGKDAARRKAHFLKC